MCGPWKGRRRRLSRRALRLCPRPTPFHVPFVLSPSFTLVVLCQLVGEQMRGSSKSLLGSYVEETVRLQNELEITVVQVGHIINSSSRAAGIDRSFIFTRSIDQQAIIQSTSIFLPSASESLTSLRPPLLVSPCVTSFFR